MRNPEGLRRELEDCGETGIVTSTYSFRRKDNDGDLSERGPRLTARGALPLRDERRLREAGCERRGSVAVDDILYGSLEGVDATGHLCHCATQGVRGAGARRRAMRKMEWTYCDRGSGWTCRRTSGPTAPATTPPTNTSRDSHTVAKTRMGRVSVWRGVDRDYRCVQTPLTREGSRCRER